MLGLQRRLRLDDGLGQGGLGLVPGEGARGGELPQVRGDGVGDGGGGAGRARRRGGRGGGGGGGPAPVLVRGVESGLGQRVLVLEVGLDAGEDALDAEGTELLPVAGEAALLVPHHVYLLVSVPGQDAALGEVLPLEGV